MSLTVFKNSRTTEVSGVCQIVRLKYPSDVVSDNSAGAAEIASVEPANKKQKTSNSGQKVLLFEGDRHDLKPLLKDWQKQFYGKAPKQVPTMTESHMHGLTIAGMEFTPLEQAGYIFHYCMSKGCAPKIFFKSEEEAQTAMLTMEFAADSLTLKEFIIFLREWTELVKPFRYFEHPFGGREDGETVEEARKREVYEEAGLTGDAQYLFDTPPRTSNGKTTTTAVFQSFVGPDAVAQYNAARQKRQSNWQCPLGWYKIVPGIDLALAEKEKAFCETTAAAFHPLKVHPNMDRKNVNVTKMFIDFLSM